MVPGVVDATGVWYVDAAGERIEDYGAYRLHAADEWDRSLSLGGRLADVHKPLASAGQIASQGRYGIMLRDDGGNMWRKDSKIGVEMRKHLEKLLARYGYAGVIPVHLEKGVYNFYVKDVELEEKDSQAAKRENQVAAVGSGQSSSGGGESSPFGGQARP